MSHHRQHFVVVGTAILVQKRHLSGLHKVNTVGRISLAHQIRPSTYPLRFQVFGQAIQPGRCGQQLLKLCPQGLPRIVARQARRCQDLVFAPFQAMVQVRKNQRTSPSLGRKIGHFKLLPELG